jgi:hypothetical protein
MSIVRDGQRLFKIVVIGARGVPARLLEAIRRDRPVDGWYREDGMGKPGEPLIDTVMFHVPIPHRDESSRAYVFGFGIAPDDFRTLGPQTRTAMFKGLDHLVLAVDEEPVGMQFIGPLEETFDAAWPSVEIAVLGEAPIALLTLDRAKLTRVDAAHAVEWLDHTMAEHLVASRRASP